MNREYLMLAQQYKGQPISGWYASEKLDGVRAFWDGGVTRGMPVADVPWANRSRDKRDHISSGLWSRRGKAIFAPDWWINRLPPYTLDGELWMGYGCFQETVSCVRSFYGTAWARVSYRTFDSPGDRFLLAGDAKDVIFGELGHGLRLEVGPLVDPIEQVRLGSKSEMLAMMDRVVDKGGEGLILRRPGEVWMPKRVPWLLKVKQQHDSECTVIGFTGGLGKLDGLFGACIVRNRDGVVFELSGFTDLERTMDGEVGGMVGQLPDRVDGVFIKRGDVLSYKYASLTRDGVPREARYWRKMDGNDGKS